MVTWQVQDSNLRRYTPTDLQSVVLAVLTCTFASAPWTSARIPRNEPDTVGTHRTCSPCFARIYGAPKSISVRLMLSGQD